METILIGDIHGCSRELSTLLDDVSPGRDDRLILLGDLVNKGPDPAGVLDVFESLDCVCLLGNHDFDHLKWKQGGAPKAESVATKKLIPPSVYERFLESVGRMPSLFKSSDLIAVHAGLLNGVALHEQPLEVMTGDRNLPSDWKDKIALDRPLVAGHKRYSSDESMPYIVEGKFYGIDTGCVYGGCLTALRMPSGTMVQVRAARVYSE
jgi:serine/threonine protein phosphatase 1